MKKFLVKFKKGEKIMTEIISNYNCVVSKAVSFKIDVYYDISLLFYTDTLSPNRQVCFSTIC